MKVKVIIVKNPAGYSPGTFGYQVVRGNDMWIDGGWEYEDGARAAGRKLARQIRELEEETCAPIET
jgi:hypothetical protein